MQTSGNRSSISRPAAGRTTKVAGAGTVLGFLALASAGWISCSPGDIDCTKVSLGCPGGGGGKGGGTGGDSGSGGDGGTGGSSGAGGGGTGGTTLMIPAGCGPLGVTSPADFETKFIAPKCGMAMCHASVFPPRGISTAANIRSALVGVKASVLCKSDFYINKTDYKKSFVLAKISSDTDNVQCPSGGAANSGGTRMPNAMPAVAGPKLSDGELACFTWWIQSVTM
jgi:hypothetical protein